MQQRILLSTTPCLRQLSCPVPSSSIPVQRSFSSLSSTSAPSSSTSSSSAPRRPATVQQHTLSLVQKYDYPNYLIAFLYPSEARYDYLALRAFNVELSNVADSVSSLQLGRLRFQWWREAVQTLNKANPTPHPTVLALANAAKRRKLSLYHLNRLIDARENNLLSSGTYNNLSEMTAYAQSTTFPLLQLQMQLLLSPSSKQTGSIADIPLSTVDHSLSHLATYISTAQLIRSIQYFAIQKRQMILPRDIASAHGVVDEAVFRALPTLMSSEKDGSQDTERVGKAMEALQPLVDGCAELVTLAETERSKARWTLGLEESGDDEHRELAQGRQLSRLPKDLAPLFLSAIPAKNFFKEFEQTAHGNPLHPSLVQKQSRNWRLPFELLYGSTFRQF